MRIFWLLQSKTVIPDWNLKQLLLCLANRGMTLGLFIHLSTQNPIPLQARGKGMDPSFSPLVNNGVIFEVAGNNQKIMCKPFWVLHECYSIPLL